MNINIKLDLLIDFLDNYLSLFIYLSLSLESLLDSVGRMNTNRESITNPQNFIPGLTKAYLPHSNKFDGYLSGENIEKFNRFIEKKSFHENNEKNPGDTLLETGLLSVSLAPDIYEGLSKKVINKTLRKRLLKQTNSLDTSDSEKKSNLERRGSLPMMKKPQEQDMKKERETLNALQSQFRSKLPKTFQATATMGIFDPTMFLEAKHAPSSTTDKFQHERKRAASFTWTKGITGHNKSSDDENGSPNLNKRSSFFQIFKGLNIGRSRSNSEQLPSNKHEEHSKSSLSQSSSSEYVSSDDDEFSGAIEEKKQNKRNRRKATTKIIDINGKTSPVSDRKTSKHEFFINNEKPVRKVSKQQIYVNSDSKLPHTNIENTKSLSQQNKNLLTINNEPKRKKSETLIFLAPTERQRKLSNSVNNKPFRVEKKVGLVKLSETTSFQRHNSLPHRRKQSILREIRNEFQYDSNVPSSENFHIRRRAKTYSQYRYGDNPGTNKTWLKFRAEDIPTI